MGSIDENIRAIMQWLDDNEYEYKINVKDKKFGVHIDIWLAKYRIAIRKSRDDDQDFYLKVCKKYKPFFVRPDESVEFSVEKITNCLEERKAWLEKFRLRAKRRGEQMKRIKEKKQVEMRAKAVKVTPGENRGSADAGGRMRLRIKPGSKRKRFTRPANPEANQLMVEPPMVSSGFNLKTS